VYHTESLHSPQHSVITMVLRSVIKYMHHIKALSTIWKSRMGTWTPLHAPTNKKCYLYTTKQVSNNEIWWLVFIIVGPMYCINISGNTIRIQPGLSQNYAQRWPCLFKLVFIYIHAGSEDTKQSTVLSAMARGD
jgi:hypothetical protein